MFLEAGIAISLEEGQPVGGNNRGQGRKLHLHLSISFPDEGV